MRVLCLRVRINTHIPRRVLALPTHTNTDLVSSDNTAFHKIKYLLTTYYKQKHYKNNTYKHIKINFSGRRLICGDWCANSCLCAVVIDMFSQSVVHCCEAVFSTLGRYKFTVDSEITVQSRMMMSLYFKELNCLFCQMV